MSKKQNGLTIYPNAVSVRANNKRISIVKSKKANRAVTIVMHAADLPAEEMEDKPHARIFRGKVKETGFALSKEAMQMLTAALLSYYEHVK